MHTTESSPSSLPPIDSLCSHEDFSSAHWFSPIKYGKQSFLSLVLCWTFLFRPQALPGKITCCYWYLVYRVLSRNWCERNRYSVFIAMPGFQTTGSIFFHLTLIKHKYFKQKQVKYYFHMPCTLVIFPISLWF